jgi:hypothetical protein
VHSLVLSAAIDEIYIPGGVNQLSIATVLGCPAVLRDILVAVIIDQRDMATTETA